MVEGVVALKLVDEYLVVVDDDQHVGNVVVEVEDFVFDRDVIGCCLLFLKKNKINLNLFCNNKITVIYLDYCTDDVHDHVQQNLVEIVVKYLAMFHLD